MKNRILFILMMCYSSGYAQLKLDSLRNVKDKLTNSLKIFNDSLISLNRQITKEENTAAITLYSKKGFAPVNGFTLFGSTIYAGPSVTSQMIKTIPKNTKVKLIDLSRPNGEFFNIEHEGVVGYLSNTDIIRSPEIIGFERKVSVIIAEEKRESDKIEADRIKLRSQKNQKLLNEKNKADAVKASIRAEQRKNELISKYGLITATKIINSSIWIGMTSAMAQESLGDPKDINRTVTASVIREQWVYYGRYLYFENNILVTFQD